MRGEAWILDPELNLPLIFNEILVSVPDLQDVRLPSRPGNAASSVGLLRISYFFVAIR